MAEGPPPSAGFAARFVLSGIQSTKDWRAALHALNKIGAELMIEASEGQLVLRAINAAKSAFLGASMYTGFFEAYELAAAPPVQAAVLLKHVLATLRTQRISQYEWLISSDSSSLHVRVVADNGLVKTYRLNCTDSAVMHAGVDKAAYPTHVVAEAKELSRLLSTFTGGSQEEVTLLARPLSGESVSTGFRACQLQSYIDPQKAMLLRNNFESYTLAYSGAVADAGDGSVHTALGVDTKVFLSYSHNSNQAADATFNVKDFKAMLGFCEHLRANIRISMDQAGTPLVAEPDRQSMSFQAPISAELVLATLLESQLDAAVTLPGHNLPAQQPAAQAAQQQYMQQAQFAQQQQQHYPPEQQNMQEAEFAQQQQYHPQQQHTQQQQQYMQQQHNMQPQQNMQQQQQQQQQYVQQNMQQGMQQQNNQDIHLQRSLQHPSAQHQEHQAIGARQGVEKQVVPPGHEDDCVHIRDQQQGQTVPAPPRTDGGQHLGEQHAGDAEMEDPEQLPGSLLTAPPHSHAHTTAVGERTSGRSGSAHTAAVGELRSGRNGISSGGAATQRGHSGGSRQQLQGLVGDQLLDDDTDYVPIGGGSGAGVPRHVSAPGLVAGDTEGTAQQSAAAVNMPRTLLSGASALLQTGQLPHPSAAQQRTLLSGASMWARASGATPTLNPDGAGPASGMGQPLASAGGAARQGSAPAITAQAAVALVSNITGPVLGMQPGTDATGMGGSAVTIAAASGYQRVAALRQSGRSPLAQQAEQRHGQEPVVTANAAYAHPIVPNSNHGMTGQPTTNTSTLPAQDPEVVCIPATEITSVGGSSNPRSLAGTGSHTQIAAAGMGLDRQHGLPHHEAQQFNAGGPGSGQAGGAVHVGQVGHAGGAMMMPVTGMGLLEGMEMLPGTPDEEEPQDRGAEGAEEGQGHVSGRSQPTMAVQGSYHGMYFGTDMEM